MSSAAEYIRERVRTVPDWPQPGIMFRDITPLLSDARTYRVMMDVFIQRYVDSRVDFVAGIDARGFILGAVIARELNAGFIPVRKKGKLPYSTLEESYALEYGSATIQIHSDACKPGHHVLLVDDLVATGGTMLAAAALLTRLGAHVTETAAIVDLPELGGSKRIREQGFDFFSICEFGGH